MANSGSIDTKLGSLSSFLEAQKGAIDRIEKHARENIGDLFTESRLHALEIERIKGEMCRAQEDIRELSATNKENTNRSREWVRDGVMLIMAAAIGWIGWTQQQRALTRPVVTDPTLSMTEPVTQHE